jgi:hypothetical protein
LPGLQDEQFLWLSRAGATDSESDEKENLDRKIRGQKNEFLEGVWDATWQSDIFLSFYFSVQSLC